MYNKKECIVHIHIHLIYVERHSCKIEARMLWSLYMHKLTWNPFNIIYINRYHCKKAPRVSSSTVQARPSGGLRCLKTIQKLTEPKSTRICRACQKSRSASTIHTYTHIYIYIYIYIHTHTHIHTYIYISLFDQRFPRHQILFLTHVTLFLLHMFRYSCCTCSVILVAHVPLFLLHIFRSFCCPGVSGFLQGGCVGHQKDGYYWVSAVSSKFILL